MHLKTHLTKYLIMANTLKKVAPDTADWYGGVIANAQEIVIRYFDTLKAKEGEESASYLLGLLCSLQDLRDYFKEMEEGDGC